ncbi:hypothetical protein HYX70_02235 [Candidatus Saccharibacteria bacterium]|nr:hypothetical protein [Candidatus Saccharibacteria bacterium]
MDDLDPLRDFRSGGPELDDATSQRIRARILDTMDTDEVGNRIIWCYGLLVLSVASIVLGAYVALDQQFEVRDRVMGLIVALLAAVAVPFIAAVNPHRNYHK